MPRVSLFSNVCYFFVSVPRSQFYAHVITISYIQGLEGDGNFTLVTSNKKYLEYLIAYDLRIIFFCNQMEKQEQKLSFTISGLYYRCLT